MAGISTYKTYLMHSTNGTLYTKFIDISAFPDLGSEPDTIDVTTLSDNMRKYILGIQDTGSLAFESFYTPERYQKCREIVGEQHHFAIWLGADGEGDSATPTGEDGRFTFMGELGAWLTGGGVNEPVGMSLTIAPSTEIVFSLPTP